MDDKYALGIDFGTESGRVMLVRLSEGAGVYAIALRSTVRATRSVTPNV